MSAWDKIFDIGLVAGVLGLLGLGVKSAIEDSKRKNTPMKFPEHLPEDCFQALAIVTAKQLKGRIVEVSANQAVIYVTVESKSGLSTWNFSIDFNDYGSLTGRYWLTSENKDSDIPKCVADNIQRAVQRYL